MINLSYCVTLTRIVALTNPSSLLDGAIKVSRRCLEGEPDIGGVIAATFSNPERFPALAIRVAAALGLSPNLPQFDLQLACSAYPYAIYLASKLAQDTGKKVLVIDGDMQLPLVDKDDHDTGNIFSNGVTATLVGITDGNSRFDFLSREDEALTCTAIGPIKMDGFKVFTFVATEINAFLKAFGKDFASFAPHQANPYMVRQLAKSLDLENKLLTINETVKNPGSCSVAMALASGAKPGRTLIAGFGAGYSAVAGEVNIPDNFVGECL